jgi:ABC-2 type transport system permease protein
MEHKKRTLSLALTIALLFTNLVALNYLLAGLSSARIDLTEEGLFSVSSATRRILDSLDEDLIVTAYFSKRTHPKLAPLIPQIMDLLEEYRAVSGGRVQVERIDPGEDEQAEKEASDRYGVRSTPFQLASKYEAGIVNAYFALVLRYGDQYVRYGFQDLIAVDITPDGDLDVTLRNLEYDLTRAIKKVVYGFQSSNELFARVDGEVVLSAIVSSGSLPEILAETPDAIRAAADELEAAGGDKFRFEEFDPTAHESTLAQVEAKFGRVPAMSLGLFGGGDPFYLYGLLQVGGRIEQLPLTGETISAASIREAVESSLRRHTPGFLKTVGLVTPDPPSIPPELRMQMNLPPQGRPEYEEIQHFLTQDYNVKKVTLSSSVPSDVDVLLVLKPQNLSEEQVYSLDQYLMRGGRVVLCAGSFAAEMGADGLHAMPVDSGLDDWLAHFGVTIEETLVLDDRNQPLPIPEVRYTALGAMRTWTMAPYPYLVRVQDDGFVNRDVTASLDSVGVYWASPVTADAELPEGLEALPILKSSTRSWTDSDLSKIGFVDYTVPGEGTEPRTLALALSGRFASYFAGKPVPGTETEGEEPGSPPTRVDENQTVTLEQSPETRLVVVGDDAFLSDMVARSLGNDGSFFIENLRFTENLIDWVSLDNEMLEIRSAGVRSRRLEPTDRRAEITLEAASYVIPLTLLILLGLLRQRRRRRAAEGFTRLAGQEVHP